MGKSTRVRAAVAVVQVLVTCNVGFGFVFGNPFLMEYKLGLLFLIKGGFLMEYKPGELWSWFGSSRSMAGGVCEAIGSSISTVAAGGTLLAALAAEDADISHLATGCRMGPCVRRHRLKAGLCWVSWEEVPISKENKNILQLYFCLCWDTCSVNGGADLTCCAIGKGLCPGRSESKWTL